MANIKSALKRIKQTKKRTIKNKFWKNNFKEAKKEFLSIVKEGKKEAITENLKKLTKVIDKTADRNILPKNRASRIKSKFAKMVNTSS